MDPLGRYDESAKKERGAPPFSGSAPEGLPVPEAIPPPLGRNPEEISGAAPPAISGVRILPHLLPFFLPMRRGWGPKRAVFVGNLADFPEGSRLVPEKGLFYADS